MTDNKGKPAKGVSCQTTIPGLVKCKPTLLIPLQMDQNNKYKKPDDAICLKKNDNGYDMTIDVHGRKLEWFDSDGVQTSYKLKEKPLKKTRVQVECPPGTPLSEKKKDFAVNYDEGSIDLRKAPPKGNIIFVKYVSEKDVVSLKVWPIKLFKFKDIPLGTYTVSLRVAGTWFAVTDSLEVKEVPIAYRCTKCNYLYEEERTKCPNTGCKAPESPQEKFGRAFAYQLPEITKIVHGSEIETQPLRQVLLHCEHGGTESNDEEACERTCHWLPNLYVFLASKPKSSGKPKWTLLKTDKEGVLCPIERNDRPSSKKLKIWEGQPYNLYLSLYRWWGDDDSDISVIVEQARKQYPEPLELKPERETPKRSFKPKKRRKYRKYLVFLAPVQSDFLPKGGKLYDRLVLFKDMPNEDCKRVKDQVRRLQYHLGFLRYPIGEQPLHPYIPLRTQRVVVKGETKIVRAPHKEQKFDLLTYNAVLAFQRHASEGMEGFNEGYGSMLNESNNFEPNFLYFDKREVEEGFTEYVKSKGKKRKELRKEEANELRNEYVETQFGRKYIKIVDGYPRFDQPKLGKDSWLFVNLKWDDTRALVNGNMTKEELLKLMRAHETDEITIEYKGPRNGVVDEETAIEIERWLKNKYRKPGRILVGVDDGGLPKNDERTRNDWENPYYWLRDDAALHLFMWRKRAKEFGSKHGVRLTGTYRSITTEVTPGSAGFGRARLSVHKTGLATDLWCSGKGRPYVGDPYRYPVRYVLERKQVTRKGKPEIRFWFRLYDEIDTEKHNPEDIEKKAERLNPSIYRSVISPWSYDRHSPTGGSPKPPERDKHFVSITDLAQDAGYIRMFAYREGWYLEEGSFILDRYKITKKKTTDGFRNLLRNLAKARDRAEGAKLPVTISSPISHADTTTVQVRELDHIELCDRALAPLQEWESRMRTFGPLPDVAVKSENAAAIMAELNKRWKHIREVMFIKDNSSDIVKVGTEEETSEKIEYSPDTHKYMLSEKPVINIREVTKPIAEEEGKKGALARKKVDYEFDVKEGWVKWKRAHTLFIAREEHPSDGSSRYVLKKPPVLEIVKVKGKAKVGRRVRWLTFKKDDYTLVKGDNSLRWLPEGRKPHPGTKFYVDYTSRYPQSFTVRYTFVGGAREAIVPPDNVKYVRPLIDGESLLKKGDVVDFPIPGFPIGLEWWHFNLEEELKKNGDRIPWGKVVEKLGFTMEALTYTEAETTEELTFRPKKKWTYWLSNTPVIEIISVSTQRQDNSTHWLLSETDQGNKTGWLVKNKRKEGVGIKLSDETFDWLMNPENRPKEANFVLSVRYKFKIPGLGYSRKDWRFKGYF